MAAVLCGRTVARYRLILCFRQRFKRLYLEAIRKDYLEIASSMPNFTPRLDIIMANDRLDTAIYIKQKLNALRKVGFTTHIHELRGVTFTELERRIHNLNQDPDCHGILVQSPVFLNDKERISNSQAFQIVDPSKDVDGLHPVNLGRLASKSTEPDFYPCTSLGIVKILQHYRIEISGKRVVVLGRSEIVGMPTALILNRLDATVTLCHSRSLNLPEMVREADLVVAAIGQPEFIKADWIKPGAIIIDVGINRSSNDKNGGLVGDVEYGGASKVAKAITPVPGGVGPMTVAMLVRNLYLSALRAQGLLLKDTTGTITD